MPKQKTKKLPYPYKIQLKGKTWYYATQDGKWHKWKEGDIKVNHIIWERSIETL
jgi:YHS domain-containing protein